MIPTLQLGQFGLAQNAASVDPIALSIYQDLIAWWEFQENDVTTQFLDSHNNNDLTLTGVANTAAASAAAGITGRTMIYATQVAAAAVIPRSNSALDLPNTDWSYGFWTDVSNPSAAGWYRYIMGCAGDFTAGNYVHSIVQSAADNSLYFVVSSTGSSSDAGANAGHGPRNGWNLIVAVHDRTNQLIRFRIRNSVDNTNVTAAFTSPLYTGATSANFALRQSYINDTTASPGDRWWSYKMDNAFVLGHAITDDEFEYIYNAQAGRSYAALKLAAGF